MATAKNKIVADTQQVKPPRAGRGRPKGAPNKMTRSIREAIEAAFQGVGGAEYLIRQAEANPQAFMTLLAKVLPSQVQNEITNPDGSLAPTIIQIVAKQ